MSFEIQEINGKLQKIVTTPIDAHNIKREAYPLTEDEYEKISSALEGRHKEERDTMTKFKGHPTLRESKEVDERTLRAPETERGKAIVTKAETGEGGSAAARSKVAPRKYGVASSK